MEDSSLSQKTKKKIKQLLLQVSFCNYLQTSDIAILPFLGFNIIWNVWPSVTLRLDGFRHDQQMPLLQELAFLVAFSEETFTSVSVCETRTALLQSPRPLHRYSRPKRTETRTYVLSAWSLLLLLHDVTGKHSTWGTHGQTAKQFV